MQLANAGAARSLELARATEGGGRRGEAPPDPRGGSAHAREGSALGGRRPRYSDRRRTDRAGARGLYSTNGEVFWFYDVRHRLNRSQEVRDFHTPAALTEKLARGFGRACDTLNALPRDCKFLRPYQHDAHVAVEKAIAERKPRMLVAMATGTGKTYTFVSQVHRLMKAGVARRVLFLVGRRALAAQAEL